MSSSLIISNFRTGFETDRTPFIIDNDAFPTLNNAYVWRGRIRKKRGTSLLGRLQRSVSIPSATSLNGGAVNLLGLLGLTPKSLRITGITKATNAVVTYTVTTGSYTNGDIVYIEGVGGMTQINGAYYTVLSAGVGTVTLNVDSSSFSNYSANTGFISKSAGPSIVPGSISVTVGANTYTDSNGILTGSPAGSGVVFYTTGLLFISGGVGTITGTYSYYPALPVMGLEDELIITPNGPINDPTLVAFDTKYSYEFDGTKFYDVNYYKLSGNHFEWSGADYQQFWSTNYSGAMWVTNSKPGFNFDDVSALAVPGGGMFPITQTTVDITISITDLVVGDWLWFNEFATETELNGLTGEVTTVVGGGTYTVTFADSITVSGSDTGIVQLLTYDIAGQDGIKWFDGDPTGTLPSPTTGWVNFAPPLSAYDASSNPHPQYLVGCKAIVPFKNRLLCFATYTQTTEISSSPTYHPNQFAYSQNGTPYYATVTPANQVSQPDAWYQNVAAKGGFLNAPIYQEVITVQENEDVLLCGYESKQLKLIFTGDDSFPFIYQTINSELGSQSTFSGVNLDTGALTIGDYGIAMTTQVSAQRIDVPIPDQVFDINQNNHGSYRVTTIRDYRNEFVYFSYPSQSIQFGDANVFPNITLLYNYRDNTWALLDENYTHYGTYRRQTGITWATLNTKYATWADWTDPWNYGGTSQNFPIIVGGNQQGFVMQKDDGTTEAASQYISAITVTTVVTVTSPNHNLNNGDFIKISGIIGDNTNQLNGTIQQISVVDQNNFIVEVDPSTITFDYIGGGIYSRIANFKVLSKQFPVYWSDRRQARIGTQRILAANAPNGQITVNIYTSMNTDYAANSPDISSSLVYSNVMLTGPEPTDLNRSQISQDQIWHRISNSFIGDTVQIGLTLSDDQLRDPVINISDVEIHAIAFDIYPGPLLV